MKPQDAGLTKQMSVLFATFSLWSGGHRMPTNGSVEPLRDFLVPRVGRLVLIDQLVPGEEDISYKIEEYRGGSRTPLKHPMGWWFVLLAPFLRLTNRNATQVPFKVRDFFSVLDWVARDRDTYDYFIGLESINAIAGILLRRLGRIRKVVYYVSDYSPKRYKSGWFNALYVWLDRFAATHADFIWDVSRAMQPARISAGLDPSKSARQLHVPNGVYPVQIKTAKPSQIIPYSLCYMGTLGKENGPDLIIEALPAIIKKYPKTMLHVVGGGGDGLTRLRTLAEKLGVSQHVTLHGFVPLAEDMARILRTCYLAIAPYRSIPGSVRYYADAGKIRAYCAAGVPVISSDVPPLGREVAGYGGAVIIRDTIAELVHAVGDLFKDRKRYSEMRRKVIAYAKDCAWDTVFSNTFSAMRTL